MREQARQQVASEAEDTSKPAARNEALAEQHATAAEFAAPAVKEALAPWAVEQPQMQDDLQESQLQELEEVPPKGHSPEDRAVLNPISRA